MSCAHSETETNTAGFEQCRFCGAIAVPRHFRELGDKRGCGRYMGYNGMSLHCGMHGLCEECRKRTGDAPSEKGMAYRHEELDRWMRAELASVDVVESDVLAATEGSYRQFYWWLLDKVRYRNGLPHGHYMSEGVAKPKPELVAVRVQQWNS